MCGSGRLSSPHRSARPRRRGRRAGSRPPRDPPWSMQSHLVRLRLGILLIILSWFPFAQILIDLLRHYGHLSSEGSATTLRLVIWGIQTVVGLVGLLLVGKVTMHEAKRAG